MTRYINTKTNAILETDSVLKGCWVKESDYSKKEIVNVEPEPVVIPTPKPEESAKSGEPTKAEIMQELDAFGIKYKTNATKQELLDLMKKGK